MNETTREEDLVNLLLKRGSEYASTMLIVSPVAATVPAIPCKTLSLEVIDCPLD
ncbi:MAG: hypothetical protein RIS22_1070 [Actinomycetota bacterium]